MANYVGVTIGNGEAVVSDNGFNKGVMSQPEETGEGKGKRLDAQESMKSAGRQSVTINGNQMSYQEGGFMRVNSPTKGSLPGTLSTIKTPFGAPISDMTMIKPDSLIEYRGTQMEVRTALHMGIMARDGAGNYMVKGEENLKMGDPQPETQNEQKNIVQVDLSGDEGHRDVVNTLKSKVGTLTMDNFMTQAMSSVVTGRPVEHLMADFAQQVGGDSDKVHTWVQDYVNTLYTNGIKHMAKAHGVSAAALENYVSTKTSKAYQASLLVALYHNNLRAGNELMSFYKRNERVGI